MARTKQVPIPVKRQQRKPAAVQVSAPAKVVGNTIDGTVGAAVVAAGGVRTAAVFAKDTVVNTGKGIFKFLKDVNEARKNHKATRLAEES